MIENTLLVGTNYHPHDWSEEEHIRDLDRMKASSFSVIRLGHLCWDSFEEKEGCFDFKWMDRILELCKEREIKVFMDIPTRPAPLWLHKKYPSMNIADMDGHILNPNTRYMEDVGDPYFRKYAYRFAKELVKRYSDHPTILGFGICNELGSGYISYSETARVRFTKWLKEKYNDIDTLNKTWNTRRWSRKEVSFEDITFPINHFSNGAPEKYLDMRRFFSDEIIEYHIGLKEIVKKYAPNAKISCNHWAENPKVGYDYLKAFRELNDYPGQGFYPGTNPELKEGFLGACFCSDHRISEMNVPIWDLEFQTGGFGDYSCPRGAMRMYAYLSYVYRASMICAWTYRSMLGGEEQFVFGLVDHDGTPGFKYDEFIQIAKEAVLLNGEKILPRRTNPEIAIAYSYESLLMSNFSSDYCTVPYMEQVMEAYRTLFDLNIDCNIIDLRNVSRKYRIVIIPGHLVMTEDCVKTVRRLIKSGTTVIMTAFSSKMTGSGEIYSTPFPGGLCEEFGINIRGFGRARTHNPAVNAGGLEKDFIDLQRNKVSITYNGNVLPYEVNYHEFIHLSDAVSIGEYKDTDSDITCAISVKTHPFAKAIYIGVPCNQKILTPLLLDLFSEMGISIPQNIPDGIVYRQLDDKHVIIINTNSTEISVPIETPMSSVFGEIKYTDRVALKGYGVEVLKT